jgi:hypothetical protein
MNTSSAYQHMSDFVFQQSLGKSTLCYKYWNPAAITFSQKTTTAALASMLDCSSLLK